MKFRVSLLAITAAMLVGGASPSSAAIPTCQIHNGMTVWFLDYAEADYASQHPLGVLRGVVDINEAKWHSKCGGDGPGAKIYVPFNYTKNGKAEWDTRWPQEVYRTRAEADRAFRSKV